MSSCHILLRIGVARNLNEVPVRITQLDGLHRSKCARSRNRSFDELHPNTPEAVDDLRDRCASDETDVLRSRSRMRSPGLELAPPRMQVDLALPKVQRLPSLSEGHDLHAECTRVEGAGRID